MVLPKYTSYISGHFNDIMSMNLIEGQITTNWGFHNAELNFYIKF